MSDQPAPGAADTVTLSLFEQIRAVFAAETPCPGGHCTDGRYIDQEDLFDELMTAAGLSDDWNRTRLIVENPELYRALRRREDAMWVDERKCPLTISVYEEWDGDGEYRSWHYPVAEGPCADALNLNEAEWRGSFWAAYFTQERLRKAVEKILCAQPTLEPLSASGAADDGERMRE